MARKKWKQRAAVGALGKDLTRRSRGKCELCAGKDQPMPWELPPFPEEPAMDRTLLACGRCRGWLEGGDIRQVEAHFLETAIWADEPAVKLAAARLLLVIDGADDPWVRDALEAVDIDAATGEMRQHAAS